MRNRRNIRGRQSNSARKKRLFSVFLLILAIVSLCGGTYAWFSSNEEIDTGGISLGVTPSNSLEISTDATDGSWKKNIVLDDIKNADYSYGTTRMNSYPTLYKPVSTVGNLNGGYLETFLGHISKDPLQGYKIAAESMNEVDGTDGYLMSYDLYIKSGAEQTLQINVATSSVKYKTLEGDTNTTEGIENSIRMAFILEGTVPANSSVADIQALSSSNPSNIKIWEPNANYHFSNGILAAQEFYGLNITANTVLDYQGIKAAIPESANLALTSNDSTYFESLGDKLIRTNRGEEGVQNLFKVQGGISKIRIYMWIEGQDVDCENSVSGTSFETTLNFTATDR